MILRFSHRKFMFRSMSIMIFQDLFIVKRCFFDEKTVKEARRRH